MKGDAWEGGHRMPFLVRRPGMIAPGSVSDQTICLTDLLATFADLTGSDLPTEAVPDSFSFLAVLTGEQQVTEPSRVEPEPGGPPAQLYNLERDPAESQNLLLQHPDIVKRLESELAEIRKSGRSR